MGTIRKHKEKWRAEVCVNNVRKSKVLRTKREAQKWINNIETGLTPLTPETVTLSALVEQYIKEVTPFHKGYKQETLRLRLLARELPDKPLAKYSPADMSEWKVNKLKTVKPATVRRYMTLLNSVFSHALTEWQSIPFNPLEGVKKPPPTPPRNVYPSDEEIELILAQLRGEKQKEVGITLLLALETAMRAGEILSLNRSNIDYRRRVATLTNTKNGDTREVPLSSKAVELLKSVDPKYFTVSSAVHSRLFHEAAKAAGVKVRFHDSRAAGLMRLSKKVNVLDLARIAGMRDLRTLQIYYRETAADIAKKLD